VAIHCDFIIGVVPTRNLSETGHRGTDSKDWFRTSAVPVVPMLLL
jgi:hypothetical protein